MDLSRPDRFQDAIVTVMGLGRYSQGSGLGVTKWLLRHGAQTVITDLKDPAELQESVDMVMEWFEKYRLQYPDRTLYQPLFILGKHREEDFVSVDCVVQNPGVPSESDFAQHAKSLGVAIESDASLFFRYFPYPTIAVTGTRGKTTTTLLLGELLKTMDANAAVTGNIKVSPLELLDDMLERQMPTPVVVELSSWMLESLPPAFVDTKKGPDIAVITNAFPDRNARYTDFAEYLRSKEIMLAYQTPGQFAVLNYDNEAIRSLAEKVKAKLFWCSRDYQDHDGCYVKDGVVVFRHDGTDTAVIPVEKLGLPGEQTLENVLTATCAAMLRGVSATDAAHVLTAFTGTSERREVVREVDEISYMNDSASVTPNDAAATLATFGPKKDVILIAGGDSQNGDVAPLLAAAIATCKFVVLLPGSASDALEEGLAGHVPTERALTIEDAVKNARQAAKRGNIVVFAPGAVSVEAGSSAFVHGEQFRDAVRTL